MIQLTQAEYYALAYAQAEVERLKSIVAEVHSWIVCAPITDLADMSQNIPRITEITSPNYTGKGMTE